MAGKRQKSLEGFENAHSIPEIDAAAERFKASSKKRKHAQDAEIEARELLERLMTQHKLTIYEDHDANLLVTITPGKDTLKVEDLEEGNGKAVVEEMPVEAHRKLEQRATKKSAPEA